MTLLLLLATCVLPDIPADTCRDALLDEVVVLSLIHISEPTRR